MTKTEKIHFKKPISILLSTCMIIVVTLSILKLPTTNAQTGKINGLVLALDMTAGATPTTIINFMKTWHYNALRIYVGWCNSFWTGNVHDPMNVATKNYVDQLVQLCAQNNFMVVCAVSDQVTPFTNNATLHYEEIQHGPDGEHNSQNNWVDPSGPNFIIFEKALITTLVDIMEKYTVPRISVDEVVYVTAGGHPSFYAECMKAKYLSDTGKEIPYFASTSGSYNSDQQQFINYAKNTVKLFHQEMRNASKTANSTTIFCTMLDHYWVYPKTSLDTQPLDYYGSSDVEEICGEWFSAASSNNWAGITTNLETIKNLNPNAKHFHIYGFATVTQLRHVVELAMDEDYDGVWLYAYYQWRNSPFDVSDLIPTGPAYSNVAHTSTIVETDCIFSCKWTGNNLSGFIFSWNGTSSWINNTWQSLSGTVSWANVTKTLPASPGQIVGYRWYCNDTSNENSSTPIFTFTTTDIGQNIVVLLGLPGDGATEYNKTVIFTYTPIFYDQIENSSLWLNISGTWQNVAWNASEVQNDTFNSILYSFSSSATYLWNVGAYNTTATTFAEQNRTLTIHIEPYFGTISHNETRAGYTCLFEAECYDGNGLSGIIFSCDITSFMENETWTAISGTSALANWTATLPSDPGTTIHYQFFINDTDGNWATFTPYSFVLTTQETYPPPPPPPLETSQLPNLRISSYVYGGDFIIDFRENQTLVFQSFDINYTITITVLNGEMNGTDGGLLVHGGGGYLKFTSVNVSQVRVSALQGDRPEGIVQISGCNYVFSGNATWTLNIQDGNHVWIGWSFSEEIWMPINLILGIIGIILFVGTPVLVVYKVKGKDWEWLLWGMILWLIGIALILGWLWG